MYIYWSWSYFLSVCVKKFFNVKTIDRILQQFRKVHEHRNVWIIFFSFPFSFISFFCELLESLNDVWYFHSICIYKQITKLCKYFVKTQTDKEILFNRNKYFPTLKEIPTNSNKLVNIETTKSMKKFTIIHCILDQSFSRFLKHTTKLCKFLFQNC